MPRAAFRKLLIVLAAALPAGAVFADPVTSRHDQAHLSMTVYQQGFALVRDERTVDLPPGRLQLQVQDISEQIITESAFISSQGLALRGISYNQASLTPEQLLQQSIGRKVRIIHDAPAPVAEEEGVLIGAQGSTPIVQVGDRIEIGGSGASWRLAFTELPQGLQGQPSLILDLDNEIRGPQSLMLAYISRGLSWQADYVGMLNDQDSLMLSAWVSVDNSTQVRFNNARIQLLAGEPHAANNFRPLAAMARSQEAQADIVSQPVGDYHLYELPEAIDLLPQQRQQMPLLTPRTVPVEREYRAEGNGLRNSAEKEELPVMVRLHLANSEPSLGQPLPAGLVRIYSDGPQGRVQFLGEDRIAHTAKEQAIRLQLGTAFDVRAEKTTMNFNRLASKVVELEQQIRLSNSKEEPVVVVVAERLPGDWEIQSSSHPQEKVSAQLVEWRIEVPAGGEQVLRYQARVQQ